MKAHMQAISDAVPKGRHALVIMDGAGWHQENLDLHNVTLLKLPPYAPELNPCEQVWRYLKEHFLSNRCFLILWSLITSDIEFPASSTYS